MSIIKIFFSSFSIQLSLSQRGNFKLYLESNHIHHVTLPHLVIKSSYGAATSRIVAFNRREIIVETYVHLSDLGCDKINLRIIVISSQEIIGFLVRTSIVDSLQGRWTGKGMNGDLHRVTYLGGVIKSLSILGGTEIDVHIVIPHEMPLFLKRILSSFPRVPPIPRFMVS